MDRADLRDMFDDCYGGYQDSTAEVDLQYDRLNGRWKNERVEFWREDGYGWCFRETGQSWRYGYNSLRDAVTCYCAGEARKQSPEDEYCASRVADVEYVQRVDRSQLHCRATIRLFKPEYDENRFSEKCEGLTQAFNMT